MKKNIVLASVVVLAAITTMAFANHKPFPEWVHICHLPGHAGDTINFDGVENPGERENCEKILGGKYIGIKRSALDAHNPSGR